MAAPYQSPWVIHLDMDAFFASVEQRDNPRLAGRPVIVGGSPAARGVVSTCSYEARTFGVHSAMPSREAIRLCPQAVFIKPDIEKYSRISRQIRAIMARFTAVIEPLSLDEAYLDVTGKEPVAVGEALKKAIAIELGLTASVGLSYCKFMAKLASDMEKPNGFTVITWERAQELLPTLAVRKLWGVGPASEQKLNQLGIRTCGDIRRFDPEVLQRQLGRRGLELIQLASGLDPRPVQAEREVKSIGEENTFATDQTDRVYLVELLDQYASRLTVDLQRHRLACKTVTLKIKWNQFVEGGPTRGDFLTITRSQSLPAPTSQAAEIAGTARELFGRVEWEGRKVRLLGLSVHNFVHPGDLVQSRLSL